MKTIPFTNIIGITILTSKKNMLPKTRALTVKGGRSKFISQRITICYISKSHSFSLSSCFNCFTGSIKVLVSFSKCFINSFDSPIPNLLQIQLINLSTVS